MITIPHRTGFLWMAPLTLAAGLAASAPAAIATPATPLIAVARPDTGPAAVLRVIDADREMGRIDEATRQAWRVALVRRPDRLPARLRALLARGSGRDTALRLHGSAILREAFRWVAANQEWGGPVHNLLQPPGDLTYSLDSDRLPIRVTYRNESDANIAQTALDAAEHSWDVETQAYGFYAPLTPDATGPAGRFRYFIDSTGMGGGGYTAPYDMNPDTPWTDCFTYIVVDPSNPLSFIPGVVAHESNHAMQAAMDCLEVTTFWENTAVYIAAAVYSSEWDYAIQTMPYFQSQPWRALDYMSQPRSDLYEYGGALFLIWLTDAYALPPTEPWPSMGGDGPVLVRQIWEGSMETSSFNEPDYYDVIPQVLSDRGHSESMEDVLMDFSEARYFVGRDDDGRHIRNAGAFWGAELTLADEIWENDLPLHDAEPTSTTKPAPYGSNHILIHTPADTDAPLRVSFDGDDDTRWRVRLVPIGEPAGAATEIPLAPQTWDGSQILDPGSSNTVLMVVANLGTDRYDPDSRQWPTSGYRYSVQLDLPPPTLTALDPAQVVRGQQEVTLHLRGTGFIAGPDFLLRFEDPNLQVVSVLQTTPTEIAFTLTIPMLTSLGPKTLILTNGDGNRVEGAGLLEVLDVAEPPTPGGGSSSGCSCQSAGTGGSDLPIALLWAPLVLLALRRRRRRRSGR